MNHLIPTKALAPPLRKGIIKRGPVIDKLNNGLKKDRRLILVTSMAGSGKTTLISQWLSEYENLAAWVSLDSGDNSLYRFWDYIITSMRVISDNIGLNIQPALQSFDKLSMETIANAVIRDISASSRPMILVLDDYHAISNSEIHTSLQYFLEHMPANLQLVIISRVKPPLSLSRLRASLGITDISFSELRLTKDETHTLLNDYVNYIAIEMASF